MPKAKRPAAPIPAADIPLTQRTVGVRRRSVSDDEFLELWSKYGSAAAISRETGMSERNAHTRRRLLESRLGVPLAARPHSTSPHVTMAHDRVRTLVDVADATVLVMSDAHYLPGSASTAHRAFLALCRELKPRFVIANGDICDFGAISRHEPMGFLEPQVTVKAELDVVRDRLTEIQDACQGAGTAFLRTIGNHDLRFERFLASNAQAFAGIHGFRLADHLPGWQESLSILINETCMVRHRPLGGGIHAAYNSTMKSGLSYVHGHLHRLCVTPWADYTGVRWGVDTGTLSRLDSSAFLYTEDAATPWSSGFAVLTFDRKGQLLPPELCQVMGEEAIFRGRVVVAGEDEARGAQARRPSRRRAA